MTHMNRRESPRMEIRLRCHVTSPALWMHSAMYTENISRSGLLIVWGGEYTPIEPPSVGQIVTVEVELPANHGFGQKCIHCQGTVVRVAENEGGCPRVALSVNYMDFRSFQDRLGALDPLGPEATSWTA